MFPLHHRQTLVVVLIAIAALCLVLVAFCQIHCWQQELSVTPTVIYPHS
ncbi:hypothetical protein [Dictyobacter formicarum]|uniref:Uncharacterized protein n=1 Tax=Dictyobacter formicarum TaxID=2778368 RepID=A0ABQ3V8P0_9CHLR|nr:hypothetical protein [Dictyobacter formicarum]GHO82334.1 hypothetical protein KSZ_03400 [Dictyobacter formicarum]